MKSSIINFQFYRKLSPRRGSLHRGGGWGSLNLETSQGEDKDNDISNDFVVWTSSPSYMPKLEKWGHSQRKIKKVEFGPISNASLMVKKLASAFLTSIQSPRRLIWNPFHPLPSTLFYRQIFASLYFLSSASQFQIKGRQTSHPALSSDISPGLKWKKDRRHFASQRHIWVINKKSTLITHILKSCIFFQKGKFFTEDEQLFHDNVQCLHSNWNLWSLWQKWSMHTILEARQPSIVG